jgi:hypothetical protein
MQFSDAKIHLIDHVAFCMPAFVIIAFDKLFEDGDTATFTPNSVLR